MQDEIMVALQIAHAVCYIYMTLKDLLIDRDAHKARKHSTAQLTHVSLIVTYVGEDVFAKSPSQLLGKATHLHGNIIIHAGKPRANYA
jgi:hypothetical protein